MGEVGDSAPDGSAAVDSWSGIVGDRFGARAPLVADRLYR